MALKLDCDPCCYSDVFLCLFVFVLAPAFECPEDDVDLEALVNDMNASLESLYASCSMQSETVPLLQSSPQARSQQPAGPRPFHPLASPRQKLQRSQPVHILAVRCGPEASWGERICGRNEASVVPTCNWGPCLSLPAGSGGLNMVPGLVPIMLREDLFDTRKCQTQDFLKCALRGSCEIVRTASGWQQVKANTQTPLGWLGC